MKNVIFFVHGIGRHKQGWVDGTPEEPGPVAALDAAMKQYACFGGKGLRDFVDVVEVRYDDLFDTVLDQWEALAESLGPVAGNIPWVEKVQALLDDVGGNKDLFADFGGDILLYRGFDLVARAVRLRVAATIAGEVFERNVAAAGEGLEGTLPKIAIVGHSMGTAVVYDALWTIVSAGFLEDKATVTKQLPGAQWLVDLGLLTEAQAKRFAIMEKTAATMPGTLPFFVDRLMLVSDTIPLVSQASGDYLAAKFQTDFQCRSFTEVKHQLDPVCQTKPFALPAHPDAEEIVVKHVHQPNIHGLAHYLSHPAVHSSLFRAVIPEFKLKDLAAAQKLAATGEWTGVGGAVAKMVDAKKAELVTKLEALRDELLDMQTTRDVLLLVKLLKRLRTISTGDEP